MDKETIQDYFNSEDGPQIWYTDGVILSRLDLMKTIFRATQQPDFNRRELRIIKAVLEEALANVDAWLDASVSFHEI